MLIISTPEGAIGTKVEILMDQCRPGISERTPVKNPTRAHIPAVIRDSHVPTN